MCPLESKLKWGKPIEPVTPVFELRYVRISNLSPQTTVQGIEALLQRYNLAFINVTRDDDGLEPDEANVMCISQPVAVNVAVTLFGQYLDGQQIGTILNFEKKTYGKLGPLRPIWEHR
jgi:hypothetical protein